MTELTVLFFRHGIAVEREVFEGSDSDRPLTAKGEKKTQQIARRLLDLGIEAELILSSPLVRARQTAEILLEVGVAPDLMISDLLAPSGRLLDWLHWLNHWRQDHEGALIAVGHEPNLSHWTELLICGKALGHLQLKKAGIIGLLIPETDPLGNSQLFWLTPPKFLLNGSGLA
ncbi:MULTISPECIES: phosphohistidine phosphatase SixA [unclassified Thermosynechococcus]|uniref:phosphohistidine phosphatase SixA n=1 Tax=unclassified Thermosynechococcus TaxID=2622553 RepID=UPI0026711BC9|nr:MULTISPECIES: phosphohistidine phosphatase SixA [unclassified Thermosynechococcus]WKT83292.1 phosphohistidine phosphatase SixA [Thermosynechococcus sp. HY596]WNC62421.1 phosphohistidine phosphatase SixA [Thermosynechococcus sp. HY591]WNC64976.1 phosphohistidine phosphatase SixA [Thermosynechococcus sp. HY593]